MRALKLLVIGMGVVLVLGTIALIVAIANRIEHPRASPATPTASTAIDLPAGAKVSATEVSGDRLVVQLALSGGGEELLIFNLATGAQVANVTLNPKQGSP